MIVRYQKAPLGRRGTDVCKWQCNDGILVSWNGPNGYHEDNVPFYCQLKDRHDDYHVDSYGRRWYSDGSAPDPQLDDQLGSC